MRFKKYVSLFLVAAMVFAFVGCGGQKQGGQQAGTGTGTDTKQQNKVTELTFWHAMGGVNGQAIETMVQNFNKSRSDIHVTVQFQGTYDDALTKLKASMQGKSGPDVVQIYDIGTRFMIDSGWITPVQNFIDNDKNVDVKSLEPNIMAYYSIGSKLYSMPFNTSTPILYYNKTAFKAAGLDPAKPPKSFKEIEEYAQKLTKKEASGQVSQYGFSMAIYGWFFEQIMAKQGYNYVNNGNGRKDKATAVTWSAGDENVGALTLIKEWKKLVDSGNAGNFGRKTDDTKNAFTAGRTAMILESTAALSGLLTGAGNRFEIGTAFLPNLTDNDKGGVIIGGGSLWMINNGDDPRAKAAWEFVKYLVAPEQQSFWAQKSGYFPVTKKAYDLQDMKDHLAKFPQFQTAIDQLHSTPVTEATSGGLVGVFAEARQTVEQQIELTLQNT